MTRRPGFTAFTLIELLVVITIIGILAGLLLVGINSAQRMAKRAKCKAEIGHMMMALTEYNNEFGLYPPSSSNLSAPHNDSDDDGKISGGEELGSGRMPTDPSNPSIYQLQLRTVMVRLKADGGTRTVGPYYTPGANQVVKGTVTDPFGTPLRYIADGRRMTMDTSTGMRKLGRVERRVPVIWSLGPDMKQDPLDGCGGQNSSDANSWDDNNDGKADDPSELLDDICSWN